jgi:hypothetical protein
MPELSKKDKKVARAIIEAGLQREFANGLNSFLTMLQEWKKSKSGNREAYYKLYGEVEDFDKHIARRYDRAAGSKYLLIILQQLRDGIITESDLNGFSPDVKEYLVQVYRKTK